LRPGERQQKEDGQIYALNVKGKVVHALQLSNTHGGVLGEWGYAAQYVISIMDSEGSNLVSAHASTVYAV